jgi:signal transduction histidine kinase
MRKYLFLAIITIGATLAALFFLVLILFWQDIDRQRQVTTERMQAIARYAGTMAVESSPGESERLDAALESLCEGAGCERIVITDDLGLVRWSGHPLITRSDDITPYLVDTEAFARSLSDTSISFTRTVRIAGSYFQSLYYPLVTDSSLYMVVVEADREYLTAAKQFRMNMLSIGAAVGLLQVVLVAALLVIARHAREAASRARMNEHLAFLGRTSAELTHELKNPLAIIKSSVDVLRRKHDPDGTARPFAFISEEIMRLSRLINSILSFSREKNLRAEPFAPTPLLEQVLSRIEHDESVRLECMVPETVRVIGDSDAFIQIADNLVRNAVTAAAGRPMEVRLSFNKEERVAQIIFDDTGPGMPEKVRRAPFAPFVSGREDGTGLGLAIVQSLCSRMEWRIALSHTGPRGTRFTLSIPGHLWHES